MGLRDAGRPLTCPDVAAYCGHNEHGKAIRAACPSSCGACTPGALGAVPRQGEAISGSGSGSGSGKPDWKPLDFKNIPGAVDRMPGFNAP